MEYLVTGGAGFIGSNAVRELVAQGASVRVLDNLATGRAVNLADLRNRVEWMEGDIRDRATVARAVAGVRHVLHFAALPSVPRSVEDPWTSNEVNVDGLLNVLLAARDAGVDRFVFSSSSSVYGDTPVLPKHEDMRPEPLSPYALQKLAGEHYCRVFARLYGMKTFVLRYFNVFGPRQNPESQYAAVIPRFIRAILEGQSPVIHGDGGQTRDFTYVADVVAANLACCRASDEAAGEVYNVARGDRVSVLDLAMRIGAITGRVVRPVHEPRRAGDVRDSQADATRARRRLGWNPAWDFDRGLAETIRFFQAQA